MVARQTTLVLGVFWWWWLSFPVEEGLKGWISTAPLQPVTLRQPLPAESCPKPFHEVTEALAADNMARGTISVEKEVFETTFAHVRVQTEPRRPGFEDSEKILPCSQPSPHNKNTHTHTQQRLVCLDKSSKKWTKLHKLIGIPKVFTCGEALTIVTPALW